MDMELRQRFRGGALHRTKQIEVRLEILVFLNEGNGRFEITEQESKQIEIT